MFIDTSAFVAILAKEPAAPALTRALSAAKSRYTSPMVRLEACMVLARTLDVSPEDAQIEFDALLEEAQVTVIDITDGIARKAVSAFARYGKGRGHPAQLNMGDCMVYACAESYDTPLLCIGDDFARTDMLLAPPAP